MATNSVQIEIGENPNHPGPRFKFPSKKFGNKMRSAQSSWFQKWRWLHYEESSDKIFCFNCIKAVQEGKLKSAKLEQTFISIGFQDWKKATDKFEKHQKSECHSQAIFKVTTLPKSTPNIAEMFSANYKKESADNRDCLFKILSCIRYLGRQGLPFRGHDDQQSNFLQLLKLRAEDDEKLKTWIDRKANKYTSPEIQNEMIKALAHPILAELAECLRKANFYSVMMDETTDLSNHEQVVFCFRWVDTKNFEVHEEFIGLYKVERTTAEHLFTILKDVLMRMNLMVKKIRGQCYDGASSMSGHLNGLNTLVKREEPRAIYTHCYGHNLNLSVGDTIKKCRCMRDALDTTQEITVLVKKSPKREGIFQRIQSELSGGNSDNHIGIRVLCPTRWTVRSVAIQSILRNYDALMELWEELIFEANDVKLKSRLKGVQSHMQKFDFFFGLKLGDLILGHSENLSRSLQKSSLSASEGQLMAKVTVQTLKSFQSEFDPFWENVKEESSKHEINEFVLPRKRKKPARFGDQTLSHDAENEKDYFKKIYDEALDLIINCIEERFSQPGFESYKNLQDLLLKAINNEKYEEELEFVVNFYGDDLNEQSLKTQLVIFAQSFPREADKESTLEDLMTYMKSLKSGMKDLLSEVCVVYELILVMPATNCVSERSFSGLRRVKTYLRTTTAQDRLNYLMLLHIHKEKTDNLNLKKILNEFVTLNESRFKMFGKYEESELEN